jgi:hypothetical protein
VIRNKRPQSRAVPTAVVVRITGAYSGCRAGPRYATKVAGAQRERATGLLAASLRCEFDFLARLELTSAKWTEKNRLIEPAHPPISLDAANRQVKDAIVFLHEKKSLFRQGERFAQIRTARSERFVLSHLIAVRLR